MVPQQTQHSEPVATPNASVASPMYTNGETSAPRHLVNGDANQSATPFTTAQKPPRFCRVDTIHLKQKLWEALDKSDTAGEKTQAKQYWQYLGQFVRGKLRQEEFVELVSSILDTPSKVTLHNHLLTAILHNASSSLPIGSTPVVPSHTTPLGVDQIETGPSSRSDNTLTTTTATKRQRNHLDISEVPDRIAKRSRVREWLSGLSSMERERLKTLASSGHLHEQQRTMGEMQRGYQGRGRLRQNSKPLRQNVLSSLHPLAQSTGFVPSQRLLKDRLDALARLNGITEGVAEGLDDLLGAALDTTLDNFFTSVLEVKLRNEAKAKQDEPLAAGGNTDGTADSDQSLEEAAVAQTTATNTTSPPLPPHPSSPRAAGLNILKQDPTYELAEDDPIHLELMDFFVLLTLSPHIHPHLGGAVWQLKNGIALREQQLEEEAKILESKWRDGWTPPELPSELVELFGPSDQSTAIDSEAQTSQLHHNILQGQPGLANAAAGPSKAPSRLALQEAPTLSRPPTPIPSHASLNLSAGGSGNASSEKTPFTAARETALDNSSNVQALQMQAGPGGIIPRPGRELGLGSSHHDHRHGPAGPNRTGRETLRMELEAKGLFKPVDSRPAILPGPQRVGINSVNGAAQNVMNPLAPPSTQSPRGEDPTAGGRPLQPGLNIQVPPGNMHGPNYWPYVDPAIILRDILG